MTVSELVTSTLEDSSPTGPHNYIARSVFFVQHGTKLGDSQQLYTNRYVMVRCETAFGVCAVDSGTVDSDIIKLSGSCVADLLKNPSLAVRIAALDAYLGALHPHRNRKDARVKVLPAGTPDERAIARDRAIASLLDVVPGQKVALIGVVNPLITAIQEKGGVCLPCDLDLEYTASGDKVEHDMAKCIAQADAVLATGMTIGNNTFDNLVDLCSERGAELTVYAQTGAAIAREFLGKGVSALSAEPFPISQMSADETSLYLYNTKWA